MRGGTSSEMVTFFNLADSFEFGWKFRIWFGDGELYLAEAEDVGHAPRKWLLVLTSCRFLYEYRPVPEDSIKET